MGSERRPAPGLPLAAIAQHNEGGLGSQPALTIAPDRRRGDRGDGRQCPRPRPAQQKAAQQKAAQQ
jgi:hypothetical protein